MFEYIYNMSYKKVIVYMIIINIIWLIGDYLYCCLIKAAYKREMSEKAGKSRLYDFFNILILLFWLYFVLRFTLLERTLGSYRDVKMPLWSYKYFLINKRNFRQIFMNILLFVPGGMFLPKLLHTFKKNYQKAYYTVFILSLLSFFIEISQYIFALGFTELDDIVSNSIGAFFGAALFVIHERLLSD